MEKYFINANKNKDVAQLLLNLRLLCHKYKLEETFEISEASIIFSIGGDGTFLESAKLNLDAKIIGINKGTLGYLTEISEEDIENMLKSYKNNDYAIQKRMLLECRYKKNTKLESSIAINDVVISKKDSSLIKLDVYVDNVNINFYYADGLIISTPTGSTGYSLSCGGPILDPTSEMLEITPIAPHTMINRSILLSANSEIRIQLIDTRDERTAKLSIDGNKEVLYEFDYIAINKSEKYLKYVSFNENQFLEKIKKTF